MTIHSREEMMLLAAWMYYQDELTHREIAERLHTSRVKITRLLKEARTSGLVEIKVTRPLPKNHQLARELEKTFCLSEVIVVNSQGETANEIGQAAANHLSRKMGENSVIGFGWSSTVRHMADHIQSTTAPSSCRVVDLVGSLMSQTNPYSISGRVAEKLNAPLYPLAVPVILQNTAAYDALLSEPSIKHNLDLAKNSKIAFLGVGNVGLNCTLIKTGIVDESAITWLEEKGAVGDILIRYYDIYGNPIPTPWDTKIIGLHWNEIQKLEHVVILAYGALKDKALLGLLRSGVPSCLITDTETGERILYLHRTL